MRKDAFLNNQTNRVGAIDQRKLVRSVLQRIANLTGERIYSTELSSEKNFVEPQESEVESFGETKLKHKSRFLNHKFVDDFVSG